MQLQENAATVTVSAVDEADHDMAKEPFNPRDNTATTKIASVNAGSLQLPKSANLPKKSSPLRTCESPGGSVTHARLGNNDMSNSAVAVGT
ncbi:hypothetical protein LTR37_005572 [Vermiconidia calcicola]|uniref:Uncharacterized protein n=1 Tax=Vermiconidia calcicola TaxID=1690605 RepID=A0ACC3NK78_9PEZI|nr:hypothetical protein LTR37_005572 [Vermiconidia calcicola]